jgi:cytochrome c biogenesis protein CcmG, thiol:disulfide interchange protein DsbE
MNRPQKNVLLASSLVFSLVFSLSSVSQALSVGDTAPNFKLADRNGKVIELAKLRGEPVALVFWATWCPTCKAELPDLNTTAANLGFKHFYTISSSDTAQDVLDSMAAKTYKSLTFLVDKDGLDKSEEVARKMKVIGQPVTIFIDAKGKVVAQSSGMISNSTLLENLAKTGFKSSSSMKK